MIHEKVILIAKFSSLQIYLLHQRRVFNGDKQNWKERMKREDNKHGIHKSEM